MRVMFNYNDFLTVVPVNKAYAVVKNKYYYDLIIDTDDYNIVVSNLTLSSGGNPELLDRLLFDGHLRLTRSDVQVTMKGE